MKSIELQKNFEISENFEMRSFQSIDVKLELRKLKGKINFKNIDKLL